MIGLARRLFQGPHYQKKLFQHLNDDVIFTSATFGATYADDSLVHHIFMQFFPVAKIMPTGINVLLVVKD